MRIGILGGTFNPIHNGHLFIAETAREELGLNKVLFIPSSIPPHKFSMGIAKGTHRLKMIELAIAGNPFFEVSEIELNRQGITYTIDTLLELKSIYGEEVTLFFIIGADTLFDLVNWKNWNEVAKLCNFVIVNRLGFVKERQSEFAKELQEKFATKIFQIESPNIDISSSEIRKRAEQGKSLKYLLNDSIIDYIKENRIY